MKRILLAVSLFATGCLAGASDESSSEGEQPSTVYTGDVATTEFSSLYAGDTPSICEQATELARTDICSLMCAPDQMADALVAQGMVGGRCVELRCALNSGQTVSVGVCIP